MRQTSQTSRRGGLGFGGAVGLGIAAAILVTVIAALHVLAAQLEGAARIVLVFGEIALCVVLAAAAVAAAGFVLYRGQLARYHLAERRLGLEQLARQVGTVHAEVLEGDAAAPVSGSDRPAIEAKRPWTVPASHLRAAPDPVDKDAAE
jgi:hypothetical protein